MITGINQYIYGQTGFAFDIGWFNSNNSWTGSFGLIGSENQISIDFISGKIFENNNFIYSLGPPQNNIYISGNVSDKFFNIFLNDNFIHSKSGNFGITSGFYLNWTTGHDWDNSGNFPNITFYGEKPKIEFIYEQTGLITEPINIAISGDSTNVGQLEIYSGEIGLLSNLYANLQSLYFEISGVNTWQTGIKINKNEIFNIVINPIDTNLFNRTTYIPLVLYTNVGLIGRNIFINRLIESDLQDITLNINNAISPSPAGLSRSSHIIDLGFRNTESNTNKAIIILSGYTGNNINKNEYQDTFSGSWLLSINGNYIPFYSQFNIFSGDIDITPNIGFQRKRVEIYKSIENFNRDIGFTGAAVYSISGNKFYKTGIIGSDINIFREYYAYSV